MKRQEGRIDRHCSRQHNAAAVTVTDPSATSYRSLRGPPFLTTTSTANPAKARNAARWNRQVCTCRRHPSVGCVAAVGARHNCSKLVFTGCAASAVSHLLPCSSSFQCAVARRPPLSLLMRSSSITAPRSLARSSGAHLLCDMLQCVMFLLVACS
jgi:hypothetical protein